MNVDDIVELDRRILEILADNARASYSDIGDAVGISRVSVKKHIEDLEKKGIIKGYKTVIDQENKESGRRFFIDMLVSPDKYNNVVEYFASCECIIKIYATTGENRLHMEGYVNGQRKYEAFIQNLRRHMDGIRSINVSDVIITYLNKEKEIDYQK